MSHPDKVMYPETGTTKADVIRYYLEIADVLLPYAAGRPITRKRWVDGVGTAQHPGKVFFHKDLDQSTPDWVPRGTLQHKEHANDYAVLDEHRGRATLAWLAQMGALELHVPQWRFAADGTVGRPDRLVLDLDPGEGAGLPECVAVAKILRGILDDMGLPTVPVTSGSKGIHLYAALDGSHTSDEMNAVARELARSLAADHPDLVVATLRKADRRGRVLVDWSQNNASKTTITPYSLRGRLRPTVAMPRTWGEITSGRLRQIEFGEVARLLRRRGDVAAPIRPPPVDRLATYRRMRDPARTAEPMAGGTASDDGDPAFVIQRHQARRLHYDFRLERDGVLVSWAVPKGIPGPDDRNRLAVHVEDHPLAYADFTGDIPRGEYGAGHVELWDRGTYRTEKWRPDEVLVTLHGRPDGGLGGAPVRLALIRTGGDDWLVRRTRDQPAAAPRERSAQVADAPRRVERPAMAEYRPMLAELGTLERPPTGDLAVEMKWDGHRVLAHTRDGTTTLRSRNGVDVTDRFADIGDVAAAIGGHDAVLDGEVVALDRRGRPDFGMLQRRAERGARRAPLRYLVFDLLAIDGVDTTRWSYDERRVRLSDALTETDTILFPPAFDGDVDAALGEAARLGLEGVVAKDRHAPYTPGRRSSAWTKLKLHRTQEVVIVGWRLGRGRREGGIGSLLLAVPGDAGLEYVGRVGTGFRDRDLDALHERLLALEVAASPATGVPRADARDARWVSPVLVGEVEFAEWTGDGRLRQASWRGLREDKDPVDVRRE